MFIKNDPYRIFKNRVKQLNRTLRSLAGERKRGHCNVCGTKHALFTSDEWVRAGVCTRCGSQARHRILAAAFQYHPDLGYPRTLYKKVVLHIAPEQALQNYISLATRQYIRDDLFPADKNIEKIDLTHMPLFADSFIDAIVAI